jgi:4'-phosphopantetheinyl transferase
MKPEVDRLLFSIKPTEVHVWLFDLGQAGPDASVWERLLSKAEIERSNRYKFTGDRSNFIARRGILRKMLGIYLAVDPAGINYQKNPYGKLSLADHSLSFNISHSQDWTALAFTLTDEVGVDIEMLRPMPDLSRMVEHWFSPDEIASLSALASEEKLASFYHIWTQKEAFLKARGEGLSFPTKDFSVSTNPTQPGRVMSIRGDLEEASYWKMECHAPVPDLQAAVCIKTSKRTDYFWHQTTPAEILTV